MIVVLLSGFTLVGGGVLSYGLGEEIASPFAEIRFDSTVTAWTAMELTEKVHFDQHGGYVVDTGLEYGRRFFAGAKISYREGIGWSKTRVWPRAGIQAGAVRLFASMAAGSPEQEIEAGIRTRIGRRFGIEPSLLMVTAHQNDRRIWGYVCRIGLSWSEKPR